jgi:hypothetical protein
MGGTKRDAVGILTGGLIAGTFDILYATTMSYLLGGRTPIWVLQSVASGLLGAGAFQGGVPAALLGLAAHYFIACTAAAVYYLLSRRFAALVVHAVPCGIAYGVLIYFVMNLVVLPLSAFPLKVSFPLPVLARGLSVHMFLIGLPIALSIRHFSKDPSRREAPGEAATR